ncbi:hypothetical protein ACVWW4_007869 [Bradyrhizobium sp. LB7.1]
MRGDVVVAAGAQDQPRSRAVQEPPDADDQRQREIDEGVLAEQHATDQRDVGQTGDVEMRCRRDALADEASADQAGQTDAEDGQCETRRNLVDRKPERHQREDQRHHRAGDDAEQCANKDRAGQPRTCKAAGGADDHHALDPEIEHAGSFGHELAGRRDQERASRRRAPRG